MGTFYSRIDHFSIRVEFFSRSYLVGPAAAFYQMSSKEKKNQFYLGQWWLRFVCIFINADAAEDERRTNARKCKFLRKPKSITLLLG